MKKRIPLSILEILQPLANKNLDLVNIVNDNDSIFHLIDKEENAGFYFIVKKQEIKSGYLKYLIEYKPKNKNDVRPYSVWLTSDSVKISFNNWLELIYSYNCIHTIFDDPILKSNTERFEKMFDILDEDADTSSFDLQQQLYLDEYLSNVISKLLTLKDSQANIQTEKLDELVADAASIQGDISSNTKRQVIKKLSKLFAKAQKLGLNVIKEIFVNVSAEFFKRLITGG